MKKRCTNNKCRKNFVVKADTVSCPYCGKKYHRLHVAITSNKPNIEDDCKKDYDSNFQGSDAIDSLRMFLASRTFKKVPKGVYLIDFESFNKIKLIRTVRKWTGKGLKETKKLVESAPVLIEAKDIVFNHLNSSLNEFMENWIVPDGSPLECFTKELDEMGCLYKIMY